MEMNRYTVSLPEVCTDGLVVLDIYKGSESIHLELNKEYTARTCSILLEHLRYQTSMRGYEQLTFAMEVCDALVTASVDSSSTPAYRSGTDGVGIQE